jgi:hypothetical protein
MTLTNVSGATIPDVRITRAYDPDPNNDRTTPVLQLSE